MIVPMSRIRVLGPRAALPETLSLLQDSGVMHLSDAREHRTELGPVESRPVASRRTRQLDRLRQRVQWALDAIPASDVRQAARPMSLGRDERGARESNGAADDACLARWARLARRTRRSADAIRMRVARREEERELLLRYRDFFLVFQAVLEAADGWKNARAFPVVLRGEEAASVSAIRDGLRDMVGQGFEILSRSLPSGEIALLILVPAAEAERVDRLLAQARVQEIPLPASYADRPVAEAWPAILARLQELPGEIEAERARLDELARETRPELLAARGVLEGRAAEREALGLVGTTRRAFVIEGWVPAPELPALKKRLAADLPGLAVEEVSREEWQADDAPVVLRNPRLFRPFEVLIGMLPLPRYGSIDPTPFVAVFFPMFFGIIMGDVGYGGMLAILAFVLHRRSREGTTLRSASEVAGAAAAFAIIFGFLFGEAFGDLGRRVVGLRPLVLDREEALVPFLGFAVALGLVHVLIGLGLGVVTGVRRRDVRHALGPGLTMVMILLIVAALLAVLDVLPGGFFTPLVIALLALFPVLVVVEGLIAPVELLSTIGHILSYARVMAIGTASVMMAGVANRMVGAFGGVVVGTMFALLFHLVNFALGLFSPTIHALRLHYVEFFGTFYSPGGMPYRPFGRTAPGAGAGST